MGFEPTTASLEGWNSTTELRPPEFFVSPVAITTRYYLLYFSSRTSTQQTHAGGQARIRTLEDISQQIYSLPPLATWVPARSNSPAYAPYKIKSN